MSEIIINKELFNKELQKEIHKGFNRHSLSTIGHEWRLDTYAFVAKDDEVLAGVCVVNFFWGVVHIKCLYVAEKYRKKGLGTNLVNSAIKYGLDNKFTFALVETMSYQALDFYKKMGFYLEFTQKGFSYGTSLHHLRKELKNSEGN